MLFGIFKNYSLEMEQNRVSKKMEREGRKMLSLYSLDKKTFKIVNKYRWEVEWIYETNNYRLSASNDIKKGEKLEMIDNEGNTTLVCYFPYKNPFSFAQSKDLTCVWNKDISADKRKIIEIIDSMIEELREYKKKRSEVIEFQFKTLQ